MKLQSALFLSIILTIHLAGCSQTDPSTNTEYDTVTDNLDDASNPFFSESPLYFNLPPFDRVENSHYAPAFEKGMAEQIAEIEAIANNSEAPTFENTLVAMERSGRLLARVSRVFDAMTSAHTNDAIEALRSELSPKRSAHSDAVMLNGKLFSRIRALYDMRDDLDLNAESHRLLEETYKDFVRSGALLSDPDKEKLTVINSQLAGLQTTFSQNVLNEVNEKAIVVDDVEELTGLSEGEIATAKEAARSRNMEDKYVLALLNTSGQPILASLENRALRERILRASLSRGNSGGEFDNRAILADVAKLRAERAELLGFDNHAAYILSDQTAKTPEAVNELLESLTPLAVAAARREAADLQAMIDAEDGGFELAAWDWSFYAEKVRKARYDFDASQLKPYFEMHNVLINGVFFAAEKVYGLTFEPRPDLPTYHPDVHVWEVFDADGSPLALFIEDYYARESKRGGAWMNAYVSQSHLLNSRPVIANHLNVTKPVEGQPTLLTWDEVTTMFHEFGHALHGMFSDVEYPSFSGTSVPRDFVEFPSQVDEMWADWPEVLANYAVHYQTGDAIPQELLDKVKAASRFNQGYTRTAYLAASLLDQAWHQRTADELPEAEDLIQFESGVLSNAGVALDTVPVRYRSTYFSHIIGGYSAGYYSYIWSEVLDADAVQWFKENGGMLRKNGDALRNVVLANGGSKDAMTMYREFRGADPSIEPLLERLGFN